jgi:uncharacterized protein (TIGR02996 family)
MTATPTHSSTHAALLAAVIAEPDDDTSRLVLADWFEEHGGDPDRAEYIRAAVELARDGICYLAGRLKKHQECECPICVRRARSADLLAANETRWRRGPKCSKCGGSGKIGPNRPPTSIYYSCRTCRGSGWTGTLSEQVTTTDPSQSSSVSRRITRWRHEGEWSRGFPHTVHCNLADCFDGERVTAWAIDVVRSEPVERLMISDRPAYLNERDSAYYLPYEDLPWSIQKIIAPMPGFDTEAAANDALARACGAVVRAGAGK